MFQQPWRLEACNRMVQWARQAESYSVPSHERCSCSRTGAPARPWAHIPTRDLRLAYEEVKSLSGRIGHDPSLSSEWFQANTKVLCSLLQLAARCVASLSKETQRNGKVKKIDSSLMHNPCTCVEGTVDLLAVVSHIAVSCTSISPFVEWPGIDSSSSRAGGNNSSNSAAKLNTAQQRSGTTTGLSDFRSSVQLLANLSLDGNPETQSLAEQLEIHLLLLSACGLMMFGCWTKEDDRALESRAMVLNKDMCECLPSLCRQLQRLWQMCRSDTPWPIPTPVPLQRPVKSLLYRFVMMLLCSLDYVRGVPRRTTAAAQLCQQDWFAEIVLAAYDAVAQPVFDLSQKVYAAAGQAGGLQAELSAETLSTFWTSFLAASGGHYHLHISALTTLVSERHDQHDVDAPAPMILPQWLDKTSGFMVNHLVAVVRLLGRLGGMARKAARARAGGRQGNTAARQLAAALMRGVDEDVQQLHMLAQTMLVLHHELLMLTWKFMSRGRDKQVFNDVYLLLVTCLEVLAPKSAERQFTIMNLAELFGDMLYYFKFKLNSIMTMDPDAIGGPPFSDLQKVARSMLDLSPLPTVEALLRLPSPVLDRAIWVGDEGLDLAAVHRMRMLYHASQLLDILHRTGVTVDRQVEPAFEQQLLCLCTSMRKANTLVARNPALLRHNPDTHPSSGIDTLWRLVMALGYMQQFKWPVKGFWYEMDPERGIMQMLGPLSHASKHRQLALLQMMRAVQDWLQVHPLERCDMEVGDVHDCQQLANQVCDALMPRWSEMMRATRPHSGCFNPDCANMTGYSEVGLKLMACGRCKSVWYCSAECQKADWKHRHKGECQAAAPACLVP